MSSNALSILTYHSLDESGSVISVAPAVFRRQMFWLRDNGFCALSLLEAARCLKDGKALPEKAFAITFDDGYENLYQHAFPVLDELGWRATVFLIADFVGKTNDWPGHSAAIERRPLLSWAQIKEMTRHGFEFGAHTRTHPDLTAISPEQAQREMTESKAEIETQLGIAAPTFAYPYGKFNAPVRKFASQLFEATCSTRLGKARVGDDLQVLKRIDMYYLTQSEAPAQLSSRNFEYSMQARQQVRDLKNKLRID